MHKYEIAHMLRKIGTLLEIKGEDPFKVRSYERAAQSIEQGSFDLETMAREGRLREIPGIGANLEPKIREMILTGTSSYLEELSEEVPLGLLDLVKVPGIGPKTAWLLYETLNIDGLDALEEALQKNLIRHVPGLGRKREETIARGLSEIKVFADRLILGLAMPVTQTLLDNFRERTIRGIAVGEIRCYVEAVSTIDLLLMASEEDLLKKEVLDGLRASLKEERTWLRAWDPRQRAFVFPTNLGVPLRIYMAQPEEFGLKTLLYTGPPEFNAWFEEMMRSKGYHFDEGKLVKDGQIVPVSSEAQLFSMADICFIPPEVRHRPEFWEKAASGQPIDLVQLTDIKGDLHVHTNWSDGIATVEQVVQKALELGYSYIAISDHATKIKVVKSLDVDKLEAQLEEIQEASKKYPAIRIFSGVEVDILKDGSLLLPDHVLSQLDVVVASIHQDIEGSDYSVADRLISAARNPNVDIIGHPTGRFLGRRAGSSKGFEKLFQVAASEGTFLEINAFPERLDLSEPLAREAASAGATMVVCTDAHSPEGMEDMVYGIGCCARRAGLSAHAIANTKDTEEFLKMKKP